MSNREKLEYAKGFVCKYITHCQTAKTAKELTEGTDFTLC